MDNGLPHQQDLISSPQTSLALPLRLDIQAVATPTQNGKPRPQLPGGEQDSSGTILPTAKLRNRMRPI